MTDFLLYAATLILLAVHIGAFCILMALVDLETALAADSPLPVRWYNVMRMVRLGCYFISVLSGTGAVVIKISTDGVEAFVPLVVIMSAVSVLLSILNTQIISASTRN